MSAEHICSSANKLFCVFGRKMTPSIKLTSLAEGSPSPSSARSNVSTFVKSKGHTFSLKLLEHKTSLVRAVALTLVYISLVFLISFHRIDKRNGASLVWVL